MGQIIKNYEIKDNYLEQVRTNVEIQNIQQIKEMGYKPNDKSFTNPLRRLIGKEPIYPNERKEMMKQERIKNKNRIKKLKKGIKSG